MTFDYRADIESAKTTLGYLKKFAAFILYRGHDSVSVETIVTKTHYGLDVDTEALNQELNRLRDAVIRTLPD